MHRAGYPTSAGGLCRSQKSRRWCESGTFLIHDLIARQRNRSCFSRHRRHGRPSFGAWGREVRLDAGTGKARQKKVAVLR